MRTFASRPKSPREAASAKSALDGQARFARDRQTRRTLSDQAALQAPEAVARNVAGDAPLRIARPGFGFRRIPVHAPEAPVRLQTKLALSTPGDIYEQEADRVAEQVMRMRVPQVQPVSAIGAESPTNGHKRAAHSRLQTKRVQANDSAVPALSPLVHEVLRSPGQPLDPSTREFMEPRFGHDFSQVRVHADAKAAESASSIGARAFTSNRNIAFGAGEYAPHSEAGRRLLSHELAHIIQQSRTTRPVDGQNNDRLERAADRTAGPVLTGRRASTTATSAPAIQCKIGPEDASPEMVGRTFEVISAFAAAGITLAIGEKVQIDRWNVNAEHAVEVTVLTGAATGQSLTIPQRFLRPVRSAVTGLSLYSAGVAQQAASVKKGEAALAAWQAKKASFTKPKGVALFTREETRLEGVLAKRRDVLNRREIQEEMFNRFDTVIAREVGAANVAHGLTGKDALDPDLVKSQLFQESQMGTAGEHMSVPPTHPVKTRFNLGQVIDSSALALLTLMEAEHKALITKFTLKDIRKDLAAAQLEKAKLEKKKNLTAAEQARLSDLRLLAKQNWEPFLWQYKASGMTKGFNDAVTELFASGNPVARNLDYEFWIHLAVFWLFEKKKTVRTWQEAIRAYNGSGARARHYRDAIVGRAKSAEAAVKKGQEFIPSGI
jgi:hypothetical protein